MKSITLLFSYGSWHYSRALRGIVAISSNVLWFEWHFFSVGILLKTLFSPWQKIQEHRTAGYDIEAFLSVLFINFLMRIVGAIIRLTFIVIGLIIILITTVLTLVFLISWLLLPLIILTSFIYALVLLYKALM